MLTSKLEIEAMRPCSSKKSPKLLYTPSPRVCGLKPKRRVLIDDYSLQTLRSTIYLCPKTKTHSLSRRNKLIPKENS